MKKLNGLTTTSQTFLPFCVSPSRLQEYSALAWPTSSSVGSCEIQDQGHWQVERGETASSSHVVPYRTSIQANQRPQALNKGCNTFMSKPSQHLFHLPKTPPLKTNALGLNSNTNTPETQTLSHNHHLLQASPDSSLFSLQHLILKKNPLANHSSEHLYCHFFHLNLTKN